MPALGAAAVATQHDDDPATGSARPANARRRRARIDESVRWLEQVEEIMRLEREERDLRQRLSGAASRP